jgi:hypothetical protein
MGVFYKASQVTFPHISTLYGKELRVHLNSESEFPGSSFGFEFRQTLGLLFFFKCKAAHCGTQF